MFGIHKLEDLIGKLTRLKSTTVLTSDVKVKLHEALVVFVLSSRWRSWFKEKGSMNGNSVCFQPFVKQRAPSRGLNEYN